MDQVCEIDCSKAYCPEHGEVDARGRWPSTCPVAVEHEPRPCGRELVEVVDDEDQEEPGEPYCPKHGLSPAAADGHCAELIEYVRTECGRVLERRQVQRDATAAERRQAGVDAKSHAERAAAEALARDEREAKRRRVLEHLVAATGLTDEELREALGVPTG